MKRLVSHSVLFLSLSLTLLAASLSAQTPATATDASAPRTSIQWPSMKGKRTQIFIDLHAKGQSTYRGITDGFAPSLMIQLPGDGGVELLEYQGSGDDWKWVPVPSHITMDHPQPGSNRVEFDMKPLAAGKKLTVMFRSLNDEWTTIASSKALPWTPAPVSN